MVLFYIHLTKLLDWYLRICSWCPVVFTTSHHVLCPALEWNTPGTWRGMCWPRAGNISDRNGMAQVPIWCQPLQAHEPGVQDSLTCCPSVPSAVTMATECVPPEEMTASWAGTVMVVPSWVTMVMVLPRACMSAWEMFTCSKQQLLRQGRVWVLFRSEPSLHQPHWLAFNSSWPFRHTHLFSEKNMALSSKRLLT